MTTTHLRDNTKTARMIATFGNLQIGGMRRRQPETRRVVIWNVIGPRGDEVVAGIGDAGRTGITDPGYKAFDNRSKFAHLIEPDERIDLRQLLAQLVREALRHAAAHYQLLMRSLV